MQRPSISGQIAPEAPPPQPAPLPGRSYQVHDSYIVEEAAEGIYLIDQHALHERILFEEIASRAPMHRGVLRQRLLMPETVQLSPRDFQVVMALKETLVRLGVEVAEFGPNTVALQALPQMLRDAPPRQFLLDLVDELSGEEALARKPSDGNITALQEKIMQIIACKGAVKAGQRLTPQQVQALLERRDQTNPAPTCPHGRPTTIFLSLTDLEKKFRRR